MVIPSQPSEADAAASEIPHLSSVSCPTATGLGIASAIAYVFIVGAADAMFIKGIDVTTDIAKTTNSAIANFCVVFTIFFLLYNALQVGLFLQK
jgi:hypothetical protein